MLTVRAFFRCLVSPAWGVAASALLITVPGVAQTDAPPVFPAPSPSTGEPLPRFILRYRAVESAFPAGQSGVGAPRLVTFSGDVVLEWGDVTLRANRLVYDAEARRFDATGDILLTRGIETVRGDSLVFLLETGAFTVTNGVVVSPPFTITGKRVERVAGRLRAFDATLAPDTRSNGELRLLARELDFVEGAYTELKDLRVYLYGQRVLTLPRHRISQRNGAFDSDIPQIPFVFKYTRISGLALGFSNEWTLTRNTTANLAFFLPTQNGLQYALSTNYALVGSETDVPFLARRKRDSLFNGARDAKNDAPGAPSPLRRFLTIAPSPGTDSLLDFEPIQATPESVGQPMEQARRFASVTLAYSGKEEVGLKRQGNLLLDRRGEARFRAALPINRAEANGGKPFETNKELRDFLRTPRLALFADLSAGNYTEQRLSNATGTQTTIGSLARQRAGGEIRVAVLPVLVGKNILLRSQASYQLFSYQGGFTYRVPEIGVAASYIFDQHTQIGGAVYRRQPSGQTPFFFDQIDTRSEAQGSAQARITNRVTAALLLRYDIEQSRLFDYGVTATYRGASLEPRFGYRKLNNQFSVGFNLVGL